MDMQFEEDERRGDKWQRTSGFLSLFLIISLVIGLGFYTGLIRLDLSVLDKLKILNATPFSEDPQAITVASNSVVMLKCYDNDGKLSNTGSGFAMFEEGVIVTNYHVIEQDAYRITAGTETGSCFEIEKVLAFDEKRDIAIMKSNASADELVPLNYGESEVLLTGDNVVAIGSPLGIINSVSKGVYSGVHTDGGSSYLQFTATISSGSSGGALFNDKGEIVGITFASYTEGQNLNLAIPIDKVVSLWENRAEKKALTVEEFYELFEHIPSVSNVSDLWVYAKSLVGQEVRLLAFISTASSFTYSDHVVRSISIVDDNSQILGTVFRSGLNLDTAKAEYQYHIGIGLLVEFDSYDNVTDSEFLKEFAPGRWLVIKGTVEKVDTDTYPYYKLVDSSVVTFIY